MVIMSGILSYGLWLPHEPVSVYFFTTNLSMYKLAILIFTVKVEKYVVYIFRKICVQKPQNGSKKKVLFPAIYS